MTLDAEPNAVSVSSPLCFTVSLISIKDPFLLRLIDK